jgi:parvulin-like peptidyl-prolyl isomerase
MPSSLRKLVPLLLLALVAALVTAACGNSNEKKTVPAGAIALVGDEPIQKSELDRLVTQAKKSYAAKKQDFPETGTPDYQSLRSSLIKGLVQQAQWEQAGAAMGIKVTDAEVQKQVDAIKQQYFNGDQAAFEAGLEKQGLTEQQVRDQLRAKVLADKIYNAVIGKVKLTDADITAYCAKQKAQCVHPESRDVRHILVKKKSLADRLYGELQDGADFAQLAKKYSQDPGSKDKGGELTAYKGKTVPPFDKFVFAADKGDLSKPIKTDFGWHIIEVLSEVKPPAPIPVAELRAQLSPTLLPQKQEKALKDWVNKAEQTYPVTYAAGYSPPPTTTATQGATTTTG